MSSARNCPLVHVSVAVLNEAGELLLVQEEKLASRGKWNLPGGHMNAWESVPQGARRELLEETGLDLPLEGLLAVYSGPTAIRFVFVARADAIHVPSAGHEILAVRFVGLHALDVTPDGELVSPQTLRAVAKALEQETPLISLELFHHRV